MTAQEQNGSATSPLWLAALGVLVLPFVLPLHYFLALLVLVGVVLYLLPASTSTPAEAAASALVAPAAAIAQPSSVQEHTATSEAAALVPKATATVSDTPISTPTPIPQPLISTPTPETTTASTVPPVVANGVIHPSTVHAVAKAAAPMLSAEVPSVTAATAALLVPVSGRSSFSSVDAQKPAALPAFVPKPRAASIDGASKPVASGGAGILARLREERQKAAAKALEVEAAAAAAAEAAVAAAAAVPEAVILYASQTGTAQEVARNIQAESAKHGVKSKVMSCNEIGFDSLSAEKTPVVVVVASSTGEGDSPDNAAKFYAQIKRRSQPTDKLSGIQFSVLGLGDSNYTRFAHVPRVLKGRFLDLGAAPFYDCLDADEVDGLEDIVERWVGGLWAPLQRAMLGIGAADPKAVSAAEEVAAPAVIKELADLEGVPALPECRVRLQWEADEQAAARVAEKEGGRTSSAQLAVRDSEGMYSPEEPFWAPVTGAVLMTAADSDRRVLHMELGIAGSGMRYQPGDSIGISVRNDPALVETLLQRLGVDGTRVFSVEHAGPEAGSAAHLLPHLQWPCTARHALSAGCDITGLPRKSLLRLLAEHTSDEGERHALLTLCSRGGRAEYTAQIRDGQPSLLDLLTKYPSCTPPLDALLDALPALPPRMYSIASSPAAEPDQLDVAFSVVRFPTLYGEKRGVATTWLDRKLQPLLETATGVSDNSEGEELRLPIFLRRGGAFRPPVDVSKPLIMIGPGTGVAPFRGFLQHRKQQAAEAGPCWLFFGCRRKEEDYLYGSDWDAFLAAGTLTRLEVAFSRAQEEKVYVQHKIREHAAELAALLVDRGGSVYVCGDGSAMSKDVHAALLDVLQTGGGLDASAAVAMLAEMTKSQRYVRDIWS